MSRPRCLVCERPLKRCLRHMRFPKDDTPCPPDAEAVERLTNMQVLRVEMDRAPRMVWHPGGYIGGGNGVSAPAGWIMHWDDNGPMVVRVATVWDGESWGYESSGVFCSMKCGYRLGLAAAAAGARFDRR